MPEIRNEVPSDEELRAYLDEWLQKSSLLGQFPEIQGQFHPEVLEAFTYLGKSSVLAEFMTKVKASLFQTSQRLNNLPRNDSFWDNTNNRPTVHKLAEFCNRILSATQDDEVCLWTLSGLNLAHGSEFDQGLWEKLYACKAARLEMVVFAVMFSTINGCSDVRQFSQFVKGTGSKAEVAPLLRETEEHGGKLLAEWSRSVAMSLA